MSDKDSSHSDDTQPSVPAPASSRSQDDPGTLLLIALAGNDTGTIFALDERPFTLIGRDETAHVRISDGEISRRHAVIRFDPGRDRYVLCDLGSRNGSRVNDEPLINAERPINVGDKIHLGSQTVLRVSKSHETETKYAERMQQQALRDSLTGAFNRRYLDERLFGELAFAKRHKKPLTLLLIDIDLFKSINDSHGHQAGDHVLTQLCQLLVKEVRTEDVVARYGGEEFAVICRDTDEPNAAILAERLRAAVENDSYEFGDSPLEVTISVGVAGTLENKTTTASALFAAADRALYVAKDEGRNCVILAGATGSVE